MADDTIPLLDMWVIPVTWGPGNGMTSNIAGVQTSNTVETYQLELRGKSAADVLTKARTQLNRPEFETAVYGTPFKGRAQNASV